MARWPFARTVTELTIGAAGVVLLLTAFVADRSWFGRHVILPFYFKRPEWLAPVVRIGVTVLGVTLLTVIRPAMGRWVAAPAGRRSVALLPLVLAILAAPLAAEGILRSWPQPRGPGYRELSVAKLDPRYGWASRPSRTTHPTLGGRPYTYAANAVGFRSLRETDRPDLTRPSLVIAGESIANGFGINYEETFAIMTGRALGLEVINVAEGGYGADQAYLRLIDMLPRLQRPMVVVTVFVPVQLGRSMIDNRPHLILDDNGQLALVPKASDFLATTRLGDLVRNHVRYASETSLQKAIEVTAAILRATVQAAQSRGARPLFVIPSPGPQRPLDAHEEAWMIRALFVEPGLPHVLVDLEPGETIAGDGHPNAAGSRRLANAIEAALSTTPL